MGAQKSRGTGVVWKGGPVSVFGGTVPNVSLIADKCGYVSISYANAFITSVGRLSSISSKILSATTLPLSSM